ncbi:Flowering-promoting factor 1-like protein 1, partial [Dionaea muscipula]
LLVGAVAVHRLMSGVWVFKNGVLRLVGNPKAEAALEGEQQLGSRRQRKVLVHLPSDEVMTSYTVLEQKLVGLGWERYHDDVSLLQFHKSSTVDLISLPKEFSKFKSMHMYDIVVKNRDMFEVRDMLIDLNI